MVGSENPRIARGFSECNITPLFPLTEGYASGDISLLLINKKYAGPTRN